jgi:hypothetical protein
MSKYWGYSRRQNNWEKILDVDRELNSERPVQLVKNTPMQAELVSFLLVVLECENQVKDMASPETESPETANPETETKIREQKQLTKNTAKTFKTKPDDRLIDDSSFSY